MNEQLTISDKFQSLVNRYPKNKLKYIHYRTVQNFIFHLDNVSDNFQRDKITKSLTEYIELIDQSSVISNAIDAKELFQQYLEPIGNIYQQQLNFHISIKPATLLFLGIPLFLFLYLLKASTGYYWAFDVPGNFNCSTHLL